MESKIEKASNNAMQRTRDRIGWRGSRLVASR